jgi:tetratricopeptide (TPR) repeat protein
MVVVHVQPVLRGYMLLPPVEETEFLIAEMDRSSVEYTLKQAFQAAPNAHAAACIAHNLAVVRFVAREYALGAPLIQKVQGIFAALPGAEMESLTALSNWGRATLDRGKLPNARVLLQHAEEVSLGVQDRCLRAVIALNVAEMLLAYAEYDRAEVRGRTALANFTDLKDEVRMAEAFLILGDCVYERGNAPTARVLYIRGLELAERHHLPSVHLYQGRIENA